MRMHDNPIFLSFLALLFLAVLGYSGWAAYKYYRYAMLTAQAPVSAIEWSVRENKKNWPLSLLFDDAYSAQAAYFFEADGNPWSGMTIFNEKFLNRWAAEETVKKNQQKEWIAWYQPHQSNHSTLQKNFPLKECISAGVLWALLLYFIWLGFYVAYRTKK